MIKRILAAIGLGGATASASVDIFYAPYAEKEVNLIYNLLFCDRIELYQDNHQGDLQHPWSVLFSEESSQEELKKIADDPTEEGRVRMLAFNRLATKPRKELLGVIVEVALPEGLDTLAVFSDGGARYINQTGKMAIVEGQPNPFESEILQVLNRARPIIEAIGPWDKDRLPPPNTNDIRLTFLVSDGLYFGQGPLEVMQSEEMAGPLIQASVVLLQRLVSETTE